MKGTLKKRGEEYMKKDAALQDKYGVRRITQFVFPNNTVPLRGKLAIWLLQNCGARAVEGVQDAKEK